MRVNAKVAIENNKNFISTCFVEFLKRNGMEALKKEVCEIGKDANLVLDDGIMRDTKISLSL